MKKNIYEVKIKFKKCILGLKSADPFVFLSHQVNKARQSLEKWSKSNGKNKKGLQYLDAGPLEDKKVKKELNEFKVTCEHMLGETIDSDTELWH